MRDILKYSFPEGSDDVGLFGELSKHYRIEKGRISVEPLAIYDTFDWRLYNESLVLYIAGKRLYVRKLYENKTIASGRINSFQDSIKDLPEGPLKTFLEPVIDVRTLLKLVEVYRRKTSYRILDGDEKTVARLLYEEIRISPEEKSEALGKYLLVISVGGYRGYARDLGKQMEKRGFRPSQRDDFYFHALRAAGRKPGDYSSKVNVELTPDMDADTATKIVLRSLLNIIRVNESGIVKDLDTEYLHDFRVAIRRTRSALRQLKNVFPRETTRRFRRDFAYLGRLSNELRDLDVYLLKERSYREMLPEPLRNDLDPLFDYLRGKRSKAFSAVTGVLGSKKVREILGEWDQFLNTPREDSAAAPLGSAPIIEVARDRIYRKYRRVVKDGNSILKNESDEMLHQLRIDCKELRYLLEFFSSLFPRKKVSASIVKLKKLQDNLGNFNDFCVQERYLLTVAAELPAAGKGSDKALIAIGSLVGELDRKKKAEKEAFAKTFKKFASYADRRAFEELLT